MDYKFKFGVSYAAERPETAPLPLNGDVCKALEFARSIGFDAIEIHGREYEFTKELIESIKEYCGLYNMNISAIVSGRLYNQTMISLAEPDFVRRTWVIEQTKRYIDIAEELNTDVVIGWLRGRFAVNNPSSLYFTLLTESLKEIDHYAKNKNVKILLEVINRYEVDCFTTAKETLSYIYENNLENTYVHLDTFHMNIEEDNICETIRKTGNKLGYIHVADNTRQAPGTGCLDFKRILKALVDIDYQGFVTTECLPVPSGKEAAKMSIHYLKGLMKSLY